MLNNQHFIKYQMDRFYLDQLILIVLFITRLSYAFYLPNNHQTDNDNEPEQCYYQLNVQPKISEKSFFYGQCMSMNGPDGCCLEGHYKPGICSNLGHICCIKPDPECNAMRNNKEITRSLLKQSRHTFLESNNNNNNNNNENVQTNRAIRSNPTRLKPKKYRTNFEIIEMPAYMQLDAVKFVLDGLDRYENDLDNVAEYLCQMLDQKYEEPSPWACFVGKHFRYSVEPAPGKYMFFYVGQDLCVVAFVSKTKKNHLTN